MAFLGLSFFLITLIILGVFLLPTIFYLLTLQRALEKCAPQNRTQSPGMVWLEIIPIFGLGWAFVNVNHISRSLGNEFRARRIPAEENPGQTLGLWMCACRLLIWIPFVSWIASVGGLVLFIMYWVKVADFSTRLDRPPAYGPYDPYGRPHQQTYGHQRPPDMPGGYRPPPSPAGGKGHGHPPYYGEAGRPGPSAAWEADPVAFCSRCGTSTNEGDEFCHRCGADLRG